MDASFLLTVVSCPCLFAFPVTFVRGRCRAAAVGGVPAKQLGRRGRAEIGSSSECPASVVVRVSLLTGCLIPGDKCSFLFVGAYW